jgi:hypothetical protein
MTTVVVDTNVILVANGQHGAVSETCITACGSRLRDIMQGGRVAIDSEYLILNEYRKKTEPHVGKRAGDIFLRWLLRNNANQKRCDQVALKVHDERGFESFPEDASLGNFDPPDRKFVAVAAAHLDKPPILQATDSKWVDWAPALTMHGVKVDFLCPEDIGAFDKNKKKSKAKGR